MSVEWASLKAAELRALAERDAVVILPVAAIEQHGPHLPVMVDTLLCTEIAVRAARKASERQPAVVAPTVWSGLSEHHMPFGGTFTLDFPTFHALLRCLCGCIERHGFRRALLLNGHGGNDFALKVVVEQLAHELKLTLATATYWHLAAHALGKILERQDNVRHACEAETSMVLALRPELVDSSRFEEARTAEERGGPAGAFRSRSFAGRTRSGAIGDPTAASAEKGERLLEAAGAAVAGLILNEAFWADAPARLSP
jgi:creatinine amidohydrolase